VAAGFAPASDSSKAASAPSDPSLGASLGTCTDLLFSQTAWSGLEDMLRVWKLYDFPFRTLPGGVGIVVPGRVATFSSYPADLFSSDDFYGLYPSRLAVLETTIGNNNETLYDLYVRPDTVLEWTRNLVANRLAVDGASWTGYFSRLNSGTYCNEFFVADYKKTSNGSGNGPLSVYAGFLTVIDQVPGYTSSMDATGQLMQTGYMASYNSPAIPFIFDVSNNTALVDAFGPWFSYNGTARALIFAQRGPQVTNEQEFQRLMRYNDYTHDPIATQGCSGNPPYSAENAVAARDDLNPANGVYPIDSLGHRDHAAIDVKYTNYQRMMATAGPNGKISFNAVAQAGPTYDQQPPFVWSQASPDIASIVHEGQPDSWTMPWVEIPFEIMP
jgi:hypothetical protein